MSASPSFFVYIDESGDEGFKLTGGSSEWFVLSAAVLRADQEREEVKLVDVFRKEVGLNPAHPIHFVGLRHERRKPLMHLIGRAKLRVISVLAHKPSLAGSALVERPRLYFYCARYLMERVSWYCRDARYGPSETGCEAKIVFSKRSGTPYDAFKDYLRRLCDSEDPHVRIHWPAVNVDEICSAQHEMRRGLQIVDAVAGAFYSAVSRDAYGYTEDSYARALEPVVYRHGGKVERYGLKFLPDLSLTLRAEQRFAWLREGYK